MSTDYTTRSLAESLLLQEPPFAADEVRAICRGLIESERQRQELLAVLENVSRWFGDAFLMNLQARIDDIVRSVNHE